jgi:hypothetical protein
MRVFKYRGGPLEIFQRDLESLKSDYFWAPSREFLNDPCEGLYNRSPLDHQLGLIGSISTPGNKSVEKSFLDVKSAVESIFSFVDKVGIYSLAKSENEELLWAHYAYGHKGFCVEYDLEKLISFENQDYKVIDVVYSDRPLKLGSSEILINPDQTVFLKKLIGAKPDSWKYEKEIRIITPSHGRHDYDFRAVKSIYFGLHMPNDQKLTIMESMVGRGILYKQMALIDGTYKMTMSDIDDPFVSSPKYKYEISPISEHAIAPELVREEMKKYVEYLYKAAEIVRREPYCSLVEMVEFSTSKGDNEDPVVFVQYNRNEKRFINHYLTLREIDEAYSSIHDLQVT